MIRKEVSIQNAEGLQSKPAALLVQTACRYTSRILIEQGPKTINAKSMMGVLSLGVGPATPSCCVSTARTNRARWKRCQR